MSTKLRQRFQDHDKDRDSSIRAIGLRGCFSGEKKEGGGKKKRKKVEKCRSRKAREK